MPEQCHDIMGDLIPDELLVSQEMFSSLLLKPERACPKGLTGPSGKSDNKRFSVYRNNVVVGLIGVMSDIFPAVKRLLGEVSFAALARMYITQEPPVSPLMFEYGRGFADFIKSFEPLKAYPYLPDIARIERAWLDVYHCADATSIKVDTFGEFSQEQLGKLVFKPHPAVRLLSSEFAAVSIFSANRQQSSHEFSMDKINLSIGEDCLITRPDTDVLVRQIPSTATIFFTSLVKGNTLSEAANEAVGIDPAFDISIAISTMLVSGLFIECKIADKQNKTILKQRGSK